MSSLETLGALERRLNGFIPQQRLRGEIDARMKRLGRTAKVHGFRPGKVPMKILQQQYGAQVHQEALGEVLQRSFSEEVQANSLIVAGYPNFEIKTADPSAEQIEYSATFEVYPAVALGDIGAESMERVVFTLSDADVDSTIEKLRKRRALFELADRPAQNEDKVHIDFSGKLDGAAFEGGDATNVAVVLGTGHMLPEFESAIVGMKVGEVKSFDMNFPEDYHGKHVAGKQVTFTVTVHKVEAPRLPELDVEFIKSLGIEDGDISKLRAEIRGSLERETERRVKARNKDNAMNLLSKVGQLEVPKALVEQEVQNLVQQSMLDMQKRGVKIPQGMTLPPDLFTERAQERVRLGLILAEVVKRHDLSAKNEQIKAMVVSHAQNFEHPEDVVKWHFSDPSRLQEVKNMAVEENVVAWVMGVAKTVDKEVDFNELMGEN